MEIFNKENSLGGLDEDKQNEIQNRVEETDDSMPDVKSDTSIKQGEDYAEAVETHIHTGLVGVTGDSIDRYTVTNDIFYPQFVLDITDVKMEGYQSQALYNIISKTKSEDIDQYYCYVRKGATVIRLGYLNVSSLRNVLAASVFQKFKKSVAFDKDTVIEGDDLFALCPISLGE